MKSTLSPLIIALLAAVVSPVVAAIQADDAKSLPEGPAKELMGRACLQCHDASAFRKKRLDKDGWTEMVGTMVDQGADATADEQTKIIDYLAQNFGPGSKVRINTAPFSEIRTVLSFTNEETKSIVDYREKNGSFKEFRDLLKVPGLDAQRMEAKKEMLAF